MDPETEEAHYANYANYADLAEGEDGDEPGPEDPADGKRKRSREAGPERRVKPCRRVAQDAPLRLVFVVTSWHRERQAQTMPRLLARDYRPEVRARMEAIKEGQLPTHEDTVWVSQFLKKGLAAEEVAAMRSEEEYMLSLYTCMFSNVMQQDTWNKAALAARGTSALGVPNVFHAAPAIWSTRTAELCAWGCKLPPGVAIPTQRQGAGTGPEEEPEYDITRLIEWWLETKAVFNLGRDFERIASFLVHNAQRQARLGGGLTEEARGRLSRTIRRFVDASDTVRELLENAHGVVFPLSRNTVMKIPALRLLADMGVLKHLRMERGDAARVSLYTLKDPVHENNLLRLSALCPIVAQNHVLYVDAVHSEYSVSAVLGDLAATTAHAGRLLFHSCGGCGGRWSQIARDAGFEHLPEVTPEGMQAIRASGEGGLLVLSDCDLMEDFAEVAAARMLGGWVVLLGDMQRTPDSVFSVLASFCTDPALAGETLWDCRRASFDYLPADFVQAEPPCPSSSPAAAWFWRPSQPQDFFWRPSMDTIFQWSISIHTARGHGDIEDRVRDHIEACATHGAFAPQPPREAHPRILLCDETAWNIALRVMHEEEKYSKTYNAMHVNRGNWVYVRNGGVWYGPLLAADVLLNGHSLGQAPLRGSENAEVHVSTEGWEDPGILADVETVFPGTQAAVYVQQVVHANLLPLAWAERNLHAVALYENATVSAVHTASTGPSARLVYTLGARLCAPEPLSLLMLRSERNAARGKPGVATNQWEFLKGLKEAAEAARTRAAAMRGKMAVLWRDSVADRTLPFGSTLADYICAAGEKKALV